MATQSSTDTVTISDSFVRRLSYSFLTLGQLIEADGDAGVVQHPYLKNIIKRVNATFVQKLNRGDYWWERRTEFYSHDGNDSTLMLRQFPNIDILSCHEDSSVDPTYDTSSLLTEGQDFRVEDNLGMIVKGSNFSRGVKNIRVIYFGGAQKAPDDLVNAAIEYAVFLKKKPRMVGVVSESRQGAQTVYRNERMPTGVREALLDHKSPAKDILGWDSM